MIDYIFQKIPKSPNHIRVRFSVMRLWINLSIPVLVTLKYNWHTCVRVSGNGLVEVDFVL